MEGDFKIFTPVLVQNFYNQLFRLKIFLGPNWFISWKVRLNGKHYYILRKEIPQNLLKGILKQGVLHICLKGEYILPFKIENRKKLEILKVSSSLPCVCQVHLVPK